MRRWMVLLLGLVVAGAAVPPSSAARQRGAPGRGDAHPVHATHPAKTSGARRDDDRRDRDRWDHDWRDVDRRDLDRRRAWPWPVVRIDTRGRQTGPAFCRSGAGHPVHGRRWCLDRGYGLGGSWGRVVWGDVVIRRPRRRDTLRERELADVLGEIVLRHFATHASLLGLRGPLTGAWVEERGGPAVLRISAGGVPFAEIVDRNRTGRASGVLVQLAR